MGTVGKLLQDFILKMLKFGFVLVFVLYISGIHTIPKPLDTVNINLNIDEVGGGGEEGGGTGGAGGAGGLEQSRDWWSGVKKSTRGGPEACFQPCGSGCRFPCSICNRDATTGNPVCQYG